MEKNQTKNEKLGTVTPFLLPESVGNLHLPDPDLVTYYKNLDKRIIWIDDVIDEGCLEYSRLILQWNAEDKEGNIPVEDRKAIKLFFFSPGGALNVYENLAEIISKSKTKVIGVNMGIAASAACMIFLACHERFTLSNASFLIHKGSMSGLSGSADEVMAAIANYERQLQQMQEKIKSRTKITDEDFENNMNPDWYLSSDEAIKYGVCDKVVEDLDDIL